MFSRCTVKQVKSLHQSHHGGIVGPDSSVQQNVPVLDSPASDRWAPPTSQQPTSAIALSPSRKYPGWCGVLYTAGSPCLASVAGISNLIPGFP